MAWSQSRIIAPTASHAVVFRGVVFGVASHVVVTPLKTTAWEAIAPMAVKPVAFVTMSDKSARLTLRARESPVGAP